MDGDSARIRDLYEQRAHVLALAVALAPEAAVLAFNDPAADLPVLYIDLPRGCGQVCYHINPADLHLFSCPIVAADDVRARWDGADKTEYHRRIATFAAGIGVH